MALRTIDNSTALERSFQANVYDLHSSSVALSMHKAFEHRANQVLPLLEKIAGEKEAKPYQKRFSKLMKEYNRLGKPTRLVDEPTRKYFDDVRHFSDDLRSFMETNCPIKVELTPSSVSR